MSATPNPQEIKEFQFKLHSKVRVFENNGDSNLFKNNVNILVAPNRFGLLIVGYPTGFRVIQTQSIQASGSVEQKEYIHRNVELSSTPSYLALNADQTLLAVIFVRDAISIAFIYDVPSLTTQDRLTIIEALAGKTTHNEKVDFKKNAFKS